MTPCGSWSSARASSRRTRSPRCGATRSRRCSPRATRSAVPRSWPFATRRAPRAGGCACSTTGCSARARSRRAYWSRSSASNKEGPPFGGPSIKTSLGLLGEAREDRLRRRVRVVVDLDVAVLDLHLPRHELATGQCRVVAVEHEEGRRQVKRAGPVEVAVAADIDG